MNAATLRAFGRWSVAGRASKRLRLEGSPHLCDLCEGE